MAIFGRNPNSGWTQRGTVTEGSTTGSGKISHGADGGVNMSKTKDGRRQVVIGSDSFVENDSGSGLFLKTTGGTSRENYVRISDYETQQAPKEEAKPPKTVVTSGGGGGGGGNSGDRTPSYGTTNPQPGNTGSKELDKSTGQMDALMKSLMALIAAQSNRQVTPEAIAEVSAPAAGSGLADTILTNSYVPSSERKKKSYLTPIAVG